MSVLNNNEIETTSLPGIAHQTLAGPRDGLRQMEVWSQIIQAGASTPMHRHECEEVIVVLQGSGTLEIEGKVSSFGPGSTLIIPSGAVHCIASTGTEDMRLIAALSAAPVTVETPDHRHIPLPWDQHRFVAST